MGGDGLRMLGSGWGLFLETMMSSLGLMRFENMLLSWSKALRVIVLRGGRRGLVGSRNAAVRSLALAMMRSWTVAVGIGTLCGIHVT